MTAFAPRKARPPASAERLAVKTKAEIVKDWLPRYTGRPLAKFGRYVLLSNFITYVEQFAEQFFVARSKPREQRNRDANRHDPQRQRCATKHSPIPLPRHVDVILAKYPFAQFVRAAHILSRLPGVLIPRIVRMLQELAQFAPGTFQVILIAHPKDPTTGLMVQLRRNPQRQQIVRQPLGGLALRNGANLTHDVCPVQGMFKLGTTRDWQSPGSTDATASEGKSRWHGTGPRAAVFQRLPWNRLRR